MILLLIAQAVVTVATPPKPANDPGTWITVSDYPTTALSQHQEGLVGFKLSLDAAGKIIGCTITTSSISAALDEITCALITARAHFTPARDTSGAAVAGNFTSRIRWVYPEIKTATPPTTVELPSTPAQRTGSSDIWVGADGIITRCEEVPVPYANVLPPPSLCAAYPVGSRYSAPTTLHHKPQKRKIRIVVNTTETYIR